MTIAYSQRFALGISAFLGLVSVLVWVDKGIDFQEGMCVLLATSSGTGIAILSLKEIRTRTKLIEVSILASIVVFAMILLFGLWQSKTWKVMLIDGAWGGTALLSAKTRPLLAGCEAADSFTWDAHKMMGVPLIASAILMKREGLLHKHFSEQARYLFQSEEHDYNPGTRSIQCGRRNDAFKVWVAWQYFGDEGYEQRVNRQFELAAYAVEHIRRRDALKLLMQPELLCVCFQVDGKSSEAICDALDKQALIKVGYGNFRDRSYIRLVCVDPDMTFGDIDHFFEQVAQVADKL